MKDNFKHVKQLLSDYETAARTINNPFAIELLEKARNELHALDERTRTLVEAAERIAKFYKV